ncbi:helix-turn-helix transcriptional regulator [Citricoccus sp. SGAir0253]|nr:helix-turn-helix transcriptional regulator [Citricoccus sp. SGAir0253]
MRTASITDVSFGGIVRGDRLEISETSGTRTRSLVGQRVPVGQGLGGAAMHRDRPLTVDDYVTSDAITHHFDAVVSAEGLSSMAAIPVVVRQRPRAVLYAATRQCGSVGDRVIGDLVTAAQAIAQELRTRDEVDRRVALLGLAQGPVDADLRDLEEVLRTTHSELIALAHASGDEALAASVRAVAARLEDWTAGGAEAAVRLTRREMDVLSQVALGCGYAEVGERLSLSPVTVKSYMRSVMAKLDCGNRHEAVATARRLRLLP